MMISKMTPKEALSLRSVTIIVPKLNKEKTRIIAFNAVDVPKVLFAKPLIHMLKDMSKYSIDHWFETERDSRTYVYRREQHIYRFNDDLLVYYALKYNLKLEVAALNLKFLQSLDSR